MVFTYQGKTWSLLIKVKHGLFVGTKGAEKRLLQKKTERPNKKKNKCPLFLILIHWIFEIIEYNLLCILM